MNFDYNTQRSPIVLREYGRCVQQLVTHIQQETDKTKRTNLVGELIKIIEQLASSPKERAENKQRIWDDIFTIADFNLDVESPFPIPEREAAMKKPEKMVYPEQRKLFRYGRNISRLMEVVMAKKDEHELEEATIYMGRLLNTFHNSWSGHAVDNVSLLKDLEHLSEKQLTLDLDKIEEGNLFEKLYHEKKKGIRPQHPMSTGNNAARKDKKSGIRRYRKRSNAG